LKVTCIAGGRYTPGIDGLIVTKDEERQSLAEYLKEWKTYVPKPVKVMLIPKRDGKTRRLGIPIVKDRAVATLFRLLMEPFWEARFEPHSYGFLGSTFRAPFIWIQVAIRCPGDVSLVPITHTVQAYWREAMGSDVLPSGEETRFSI
jgi:hypothetical protein